MTNKQYEYEAYVFQNGDKKEIWLRGSLYTRTEDETEVNEIVFKFRELGIKVKTYLPS